MSTPEDEVDWGQDMEWMRDMPPGMPTGPFVPDIENGETVEEEPNEEAIQA
jgi:hypothetical protein